MALGADSKINNGFKIAQQNSFARNFALEMSHVLEMSRALLNTVIMIQFPLLYASLTFSSCQSTISSITPKSVIFVRENDVVL